MSHVVQGQQESVSDFGIRMNILLQKAIENIKEKSNSRDMINGANSAAVECFMMGLRRSIASLLVGKSFLSLKTAIKQAIEAEYVDKRRQDLHRVQSTQSFQRRTYGSAFNQSNRPINKREDSACYIMNERGITDDKRAKINCYQCGELGHYSCKCKERRETRTCFYCKKPGHVIKDCRSRQYQERQKDIKDEPNKDLNLSRVRHMGVVASPQSAQSNAPKIEQLLSSAE